MTAIADMNEDELRRVVMQQSDAILVLKAELQAARMPDAIERTIRFALVQFGEAESMLDADDALAWLDARKDVK